MLYSKMFFDYTSIKKQNDLFILSLSSPSSLSLFSTLSFSFSLSRFLIVFFRSLGCVLNKFTKSFLSKKETTNLVNFDVPLALLLQTLQPLLVVDALFLAHALQHGQDTRHHALQAAEVHVRAAVEQLEDSGPCIPQPCPGCTSCRPSCYSARGTGRSRSGTDRGIG